MTFKYIVYLFLIVSTFQQAQTRIKVMTYNLMHYPTTYYYDDNTNSYIDRTQVLKSILDSYQPDIFSVCELQNETGANQILNLALATPDNTYNRAQFVVNQSSNDDTLQQLVFYNQKKLTLLSQDVINTRIRDINHYHFKLNTDVEVLLDVFVAHLKASSDSESENKRLEMVNQFTSYLTNLNSESYVVFTGDFNFYNSNEPGYQEILDPTNAIVMKDPIDMPGSWSNNSTFAPIHTQSPITSNGHFVYPNGSNDGVTGGMDDRFDFIMLSQNMMINGNLTYVSNTYKAYGNNGNCYNNSINNSQCSGNYSQELRDLLFNMSDHIPVVLELETPYSLNIQDFELVEVVNFTNGNIQNSTLILKITDYYLGSKYKIINSLGQILDNGTLSELHQNINIEHLNQGIYFLYLEKTNQILKFVKN